jgi:uncharacterized membrane protein SpoIIM required for sporulation
VWHFYTTVYPRIFRRLLPYTLAATVLLVCGVVLGAGLALTNSEFIRQFLGPGMVSTIEHHEMWTHSIVGVEPQSSSAILTNNLSVSFVAYASGIAAGLGTLYMMFYNGLLLGVIGAACWLNNMSDQLWSFVAPHGVLELPSICIAGGAGLRLIVGIIPILILAGIIEGFFSPSGVRMWIKFAFAAALFVGFFFYLFAAGRKGEELGAIKGVAQD